MFSARSRDALSLGPWRRRRRYARLLRELDRLDAGKSLPRRSRPRDWRRRLTATALAVVLVMAIGGTFAHKQFGLTLTRDGLQLETPLGSPPEVAQGAGSYAYMLTQRGSDRPVAYDPCRRIEYLVNDSLAPAGTEGLLRSAIDEISGATGLVFRAVGETDDLPKPKLSALTPRRKPVLIAWTTPDVVPDLAGDVAGLGGSTAGLDDYAGELRYVTGMVALDAPQLTQVLAGPGGPQQVRAVMVHELGHLVGLAHVDDDGELMYPDNLGRVSLGPGDRQGLAALGSGRCFH